MEKTCTGCVVSAATYKPAEAVHQIHEPQTKKTEALSLADWLTQGGWPSYVPQEAAAELLRLHAENEALKKQMAAAQQAVQPVAPDDWRDQFSESVYEDLSAACNQDVPLEEYPARILNILDAIVGPRHPTVIKWRNDAIRSCIAIAYKYCSDPESYRYLKQDLEAMLAAPAHPAEGVPAQAVAVADARSARQITDAIVENFKDAGWYVPSVDEALVLEAVSAAIVEHGTTEPLTGVATDVDSMARVLMAAFAKAEPEHPITRYPTSFVSTFADMARAALAATQLADGVPAQSYVADFFRENGFYPSLAQAFAAGVAHAAATQPAAQGMDALTHAELLEIKRAIQDWDEWGETDVPYELLMRGVKAGYLECGHVIPLRPGALDAAIDAAIAAKAKPGEQP